MRIRYLLLHAYGMGGTIRTVLNQAAAMAEHGHEVEIVSVVRRREKPHFPFDPRLSVTTLVDQRDGVLTDSVVRKVWRRVRGKVVPLGEFAAEYFTERVEKAVIDYVSALDDGVLVTTRPALNLIAARRGSKHVTRVAQEHMNLSAYREPVRADIFRHYHKLDAVTVLTTSSRDEYRRAVPDTPVVRIPNAVQLPAGTTPSQQENPVVVAAGRLVHQKGFDMLIPAFAHVAERHPQWRLRIFGTGPKRARLKALISEHGLDEHVHLMGRTTTLGEELSQASIYALSSRFEGLPMVMIEAMGHALPIVAFDCPTGPADVLSNGKDGVIVPPRDVDAFATALDQLMSDRDRRLRMGAEAAATARNFAPDVVMPVWVKFFDELAHGKSVTGSRP
ncbi:Glycosyltransferase involved in cell wall bisynthesis [Sinosporangium album]|uniref:Glycosyltransferase involved in cell wall bisynthesis n=1 Tax=Sinosporangium album TaxID=504805 RepID=A0A1G8J196_9ACTN|nr:glycosyltransferase family 4 protein [Sinosporangium album]SDI25019.1 Glycosyltransferase involved in cell wall bisynthesis [Sinosporangium album]